MTNDFRVILAVTKGSRPSRPAPDACKFRGDEETRLWDLMQACWDQQPTSRPIASQIVNQLYIRFQLQATNRGRPGYGVEFVSIDEKNSKKIQRDESSMSLEYLNKDGTENSSSPPNLVLGARISLPEANVVHAEPLRFGRKAEKSKDRRWKIGQTRRRVEQQNEPPHNFDGSSDQGDSWVVVPRESLHVSSAVRPARIPLRSTPTVCEPTLAVSDSRPEVHSLSIYPRSRSHNPNLSSVLIPRWSHSAVANTGSPLSPPDTAYTDRPVNLHPDGEFRPTKRLAVTNSASEEVEPVSPVGQPPPYEYLPGNNYIPVPIEGRNVEQSFTDYDWAPRPPIKEVYERLGDFFPNVDLDNSVADLYKFKPADGHMAAKRVARYLSKALPDPTGRLGFGLTCESLCK